MQHGQKERAREGLGASVLDEDRVYLGDNGRAFCGACAGFTAQMTGRDLSGARVVLVDALMARRMNAELTDIGQRIACESCGRVALEVEVVRGPCALAPLRPDRRET